MKREATPLGWKLAMLVSAALIVLGLVTGASAMAAVGIAGMLVAAAGAYLASWMRRPDRPPARRLRAARATPRKPAKAPGMDSPHSAGQGSSGADRVVSAMIASSRSPWSGWAHALRSTTSG